MTKCPMCQKQKSEYEMRPLLNVKELQVAQELSEDKNEREVGGTKVDIVCRSCWEEVLKNRTKEEVIEMFETLCGLLFEMDKKAKDMQGVIEKTPMPYPTWPTVTVPHADPNVFPMPNQGPIWIGPGPLNPHDPNIVFCGGGSTASNPDDPRITVQNNSEFPGNLLRQGTWINKMALLTAGDCV